MRQGDSSKPLFFKKNKKDLYEMEASDLQLTFNMFP